MSFHTGFVAAFAVAIIIFAPGATSGGAQEGTEIPGAPLDRVVVHVASIDKDTPLRIRRFSADNADPGHVKAKHRNEFETMKREGPEMLAGALVTSLRAAGFKDVEIIEGDEGLPASRIVIGGEFTVLHPGSQSTRVWIGLGAGKSKTCISGQITDQDGEVLAEFDHCRVGVWWGGSEEQMRDDSQQTGEHIAAFLHEWAEGEYDR